MTWTMVVGLLLEGVLIFYAVARYLTQGIGQAFGYPSATWWKFWR